MCLLDLFKKCFVAALGRYADWVSLVHQIGKDNLLRKWKYKEIMRTLASRQKWSTAPTPRQWSQVVRMGYWTVPDITTAKGRLVLEILCLIRIKFWWRKRPRLWQSARRVCTWLVLAVCARVRMMNVASLLGLREGTLMSSDAEFNECCYRQ